MSIATVVTRGFGSFGLIPFVVTRGYTYDVTYSPPLGSTERTVFVSAEDRSVPVASEDRTVMVPAEARSSLAA